MTTSPPPASRASAPYARYYLDTFRSAALASAIEPIEAPIGSAADVETVMRAPSAG
jgi:hypothetical protein